MSIENQIAFQYKYNILDDFYNPKYAENESENNIKIVAIKLTNNSDKTIQCGSDLRYNVGGREVVPVQLSNISWAMKQKTEKFWWNLITTLSFVYVYDGTSTTIYPIGLILGPGLTLLQFVIANSADKAFNQDIIQNDLSSKQIKKGETVYGYLAFRNIDPWPISVTLIK